MHTKTFTKHIPQFFAAVCALALTVSLGACGSSDSSKGSGSDSSSNSSSNSSSDSSEALKGFTQIAGVTATGDLGSKPKVTFQTPTTFKDNSYAVLQKGDGAVIEDTDRVCTQVVFLNGKDGSELGNTWDKNTPDCSLDLTSSSISSAYKELIVGQKLNTTIAIGVSDSNSSGTSYLTVLTLVSKPKDYDKATGTEVTDIPSDLPKVTRGKDGKPSIDMNGYQGSDKLVAQTLVKGSGAEVTNKNTVKVKYTGWLLDGTQFDSSWDKNTTLDADTFSGGQHTVIEGWQQGMVGQTVGSQVLLVIPPDLAYGDKKTGSIPANSTLVFVVDILAAY